MSKLIIIFICLFTVSHAIGQKNIKKIQGKTKVVSFKNKDTRSKPDIVYFSCRRVEIAAKFKEGNDAWNKYLQQNVDTTIPKFNGAPPETYKVSVYFIISRDGSITKIIPITNVGYGMEDEVIKAIENSPKWSPALQNGRAVIEYKKQDVTFTVSELLITRKTRSSISITNQDFSKPA